jgi:hypothetical protein
MKIHDPTVIRYFAANYAFTFGWALLVLLGMIGLGRLVAMALRSETAGKAGWGLHAAWGTGLYLFLGGTLALLGICTSAAISLLIGIGVAAWIWTIYRAGLPTKADLAAVPWQMWPVFAAALLMFAGGLCWQGNVNHCDDLGSYYNLCEKLLVTGSFDEPFSWRRLASLGGHILLQCTVLSNASYANIQGFERSICPMIILGMIVGFRGGSLARTPLGILIALMTLTTPIVRINTTSHLTAMTLLVGLFVTLDLAEKAGPDRLRLLLAAGLTAAACCTTRAQNVAAAGLTLGLFWIGSWIKEKRPLREAIVEACFWGGSLFVSLLPWMAMEMRSNQSPLFPLFPGTNNLAFDPQSVSGSFYVRMGAPMEMVLEADLFPLILCLIVLPEWRRGLAAWAAGIAGVITALLLAYGVSMVPDQWTIPRYVQPLLLAGALAALMTAALTPRRRVVAWVMTGLLMILQFPERCHELWNHYRTLSHAEKMIMPYGSRVIADYREAQLLIPEGERILVCTDFPFLFDHQRNPISSIDMPGACSPAPGLPHQKPPAETKEYFRKCGFDYVIFIDFDKSDNFYSRPIWKKHAVGNIALWKIQSSFFLDFFSTMDHLATTETVLGRVGDLSVLKLTR